MELGILPGQALSGLVYKFGGRSQYAKSLERIATDHGGKVFVGQEVAIEEELMRLRCELAQIKKERDF